MTTAIKHRLRWRARPGTRAAMVLHQLNRLRRRRTMRLRITDWWHGRHCQPTQGGVDDPALCRCGHYLYIHRPDGGCIGWARDQWLGLGRVRFSLRCRCQVEGE